MLIERHREKLLNAIIFFATKTNACGKTKLFKLLYFLDFEHFKQTGRSVTGLGYFAWPKGPVPVDLHNEIKAPKVDMTDYVQFETVLVTKGSMEVPRPLREFDPSHFSNRELEILNHLVSEYRDARADDMIEATHLENKPWHQVYEVEGRKQNKIPYEYALNKQEVDVMSAVIKEQEEIKKNYG